VHIPAGAITIIGLAVAGSNFYSLSEASLGLGVRDRNWVRMRKEEGSTEYYRIVMRTVLYLLVGLGILAFGIMKFATNHWEFWA